MTIYAVSSIADYYDGNGNYLRTDGVFLTREQAESYIKKDQDEVLQMIGEELSDPIICKHTITDDSHLFQWRIDELHLDDRTKHNFYWAIQHEFDVEDVKYTAKMIDRKLPQDKLDQIAKIKRKNEDNSDVWYDAAVQAICETIGEEK